MKSLSVIVLSMTLLLAGACTSMEKPTAEEYAAAQAVVNDPTATPSELEVARQVVLDYEGPSVDWRAVGVAALGAVLGIPALGSRGRALIGVASSAIARGDVSTALKSAAAYAGPRTSNDLIAAHNERKKAT
jgi:outer membrane lipoprotein SlyB